ncbi:MAG: tRNA1(Val) (adenine(37)-N6)-methyltransferase [Bilifractor sp.]|jgi:tRNA1Val (adenine37-N6)-methyltransferase|nr:tRNA1(Val) (adenine(37)-N6)-methyltransferase [Lachnospiraceae bacterium]MDY2837202.1 tRNA1(Val) (adenine(37)-N6)-methyltransferase [Bilifractor sp.]
MSPELKEGEHLDDLQNGFFIIQGEKSFRYGIDAVLLSGYAKVKPGERVLDLGTGTGILPILLAAKTPGKSFTGLEIQQKSADMAQRSVAMNHLEDRISIVQGDIREAVSIFGAASFDVAVSNPPYMIGHHGLTNPDPAVAIARHEILCSFRDIVEQTSRVLTDRGRFYLIHRPFRLAEILCILKEYRLEPKRMRLVYPFVDKEPNMVLVEACKNGNPRIQVEKPLIVYERPGVYTREIREIYGDGR